MFSIPMENSASCILLRDKTKSIKVQILSLAPIYKLSDTGSTYGISKYLRKVADLPSWSITFNFNVTF